MIVLDPLFRRARAGDRDRSLLQVLADDEVEEVLTDAVRAALLVHAAHVGGGSRTSVSYVRATAAMCIAMWSATEPTGFALRSIGIEMIVLPV